MKKQVLFLIVLLAAQYASIDARGIKVESIQQMWDRLHEHSLQHNLTIEQEFWFKSLDSALKILERGNNPAWTEQEINHVGAAAELAEEHKHDPL